MRGALRFAVISDSHFGFNKAANPDVIGTLQVAVAKVSDLHSISTADYVNGQHNLAIVDASQ